MNFNGYIIETCYIFAADYTSDLPVNVDAN